MKNIVIAKNNIHKNRTSGLKEEAPLGSHQSPAMRESDSSDVDIAWIEFNGFKVLLPWQTDRDAYVPNKTVTRT